MNRDKKWFRSLLAAVVFAAAASASHAAYWSDAEYNPNLVSTNSPYQGQLDIKNDGYTQGPWTITGAALTFWLADNATCFFCGPDRGDEKVSFSWDGGGSAGPYEVGGLAPFIWDDFGAFGVNFSEVYDGVLNFTVTATQGDFWYKASLLEVTGERKVAVPEPASLGLLGASLVGMGLMRRRKYKSAE